MGLFITEIIKEQFGTEKEAVMLYEKETGKNVMSLYKETFLGDNVQKGTLFEFYTFKKLYKIKGHKRFLFNLIIPSKTGTTEIDVVFIHTTGIFVYECKSYSGSIYGKEKYKMWTQYFNNKKSQFFNPIMQNQGHINNLKNLLSEKESEKIYSFIAFSSRAILKVEYDPNKKYIGYIEECINTNKWAIKKMTNHFTDQEIDDIYNKLYKYTNYTKEDKQKHIEHVKNKQM